MSTSLGDLLGSYENLLFGNLKPSRNINKMSFSPIIHHQLPLLSCALFRASLICSLHPILNSMAEEIHPVLNVASTKVSQDFESDL